MVQIHPKTDSVDPAPSPILRKDKVADPLARGTFVYHWGKCLEQTKWNLESDDTDAIAMPKCSNNVNAMNKRHTGCVDTKFLESKIYDNWKGGEAAEY